MKREDILSENAVTKTVIHFSMSHASSVFDWKAVAVKPQDKTYSRQTLASGSFAHLQYGVVAFRSLFEHENSTWLPVTRVDCRQWSALKTAKNGLLILAILNITLNPCRQFTAKIYKPVQFFKMAQRDACFLDRRKQKGYLKYSNSRIEKKLHFTSRLWIIPSLEMEIGFGLCYHEFQST